MITVINLHHQKGFWMKCLNVFIKQPLLSVFEHTVPHRNKVPGFSLFRLTVREQTVPQPAVGFTSKPAHMFK